jgi:hypothetical protein
MLHPSVLIGIAILALIAASFTCDWIRLSTIKSFAQENGLGTIPMNLFKSAGAVQQIKAQLPVGQMRNRVKTLETVSFFSWIASVALLLVSVLIK